jgi:hypothetical protein
MGRSPLTEGCRLGQGALGGGVLTQETTMPLGQRANVTLADAEAELAEVEETSRERCKALRALIKVLKAEQPKTKAPDDAEA